MLTALPSDVSANRRGFLGVGPCPYPCIGTDPSYLDERTRNEWPSGVLRAQSSRLLNENRNLLVDGARDIDGLRGWHVDNTPGQCRE